MDYELQSHNQSSSYQPIEIMDYDHCSQISLSQLTDKEGSDRVLSDITSNKDNELSNNEGNEIISMEMTLNVNDTFKDWDAVEIAVNTYAKQQGFVAIKYRKDLDAIDKSIIRRRVYNCWKSGTNNSKKVEDISLHRESTSIKTNYLWYSSYEAQ